MIDVDASAAAARERRRTWMLGGGLFAASALLMLAVQNLPGIPYVQLSTLLFAAGAVVFGIGWGRAGSVTARRPLGTGAIIALAAWLLLSPLNILFLPADPSFDDQVARGDYVLLMTMLRVTLEVVTLVLAIIAVVQIGRTGKVPRPWNWAPLWALGAVIVMRVLRSGLLFGPALAENPDAYLTLISFSVFFEAAAIGFLGVMAMILAGRPAPGSTTVYSSES